METYYKVGGSLNLNHPTYVVRKADQELLKNLKNGEYCLVLNSRQMGKSSLRVRTAKKLRSQGIKCVSIDLTLIGSHVTPEKWYRGIASLLLNSFELDTEIELSAWWEQYNSLTEIQKIDQLIKTVLLDKIPEQIVIFIDEIDSLLKVEFKEDFFAFIRACYNQRAEVPQYDHLTFCLLGVASPRDLVTDKKRTPFNIGYSIDLTGFTFAECKNALIPGLVNKFSDPETVLQEVLYWTGGQPFLTQKVCRLLVDKTEDQAGNITKIIQQYIIENWESQDEPEHLRTIQDRLLINDTRAIQLLGLYQQVLESQPQGVSFNNSDAQTELRLSGLVVKNNNYLQVSNPIYQSVFNPNWINYKLGQLWPYTETVNNWLKSNRDPSYLLQGKSLELAQNWSKGKILSDLAYQFLSLSQAEQDRKANQILNQAVKKAKRILTVTTITAIGIIFIATFYTGKQVQKLREFIKLEKQGNEIIQNFESNQLQSLLSALKTGQSLTNFVNPKQSFSDYIAISPVSALLNILNNISEKNQLEGHKNTVRVVTFSPDGKLIISGDDEGIINLWQQDGTLVKKIKNKPDSIERVYSLSFSPQGDIFASGSLDGNIKLWQKDGTLLKVFQKSGSVYSLKFSPDGKMIASAGKDGMIKLWDLQGNLLTILVDQKESSHPRIYSIAFSPDGQLIIAGRDDGRILIWDKKGKLLNSFKAHSYEINTIAFSPDGQLIASGGNDQKIKLWKRNGTPDKTLAGHNNSVFGVSFSPDGQFLASASSDNTIKLWKTQGNDQPLKTLNGHKDRVLIVNFSPDGKLLASGSQDQTVKLWNIKPLTSGQSTITSIAFSRDGKILALGKIDGKIELRDGEKIKVIEKHSAEITNIVFNSDDKTFLSGSSDGQIQLWTKEGYFLKTITSFPGDDAHFAFSPDGKTFAVNTDDGTVKLLSIDGTINKTLIDKQKQITRLTFSFDDRTFVAGDQNGTVSLWNIDGSLLTQFSNYNSPVTSIAFSTDRKLLASAYTDGTVKLWQKNGTPILTLIGQGAAVTSISFSPDRKTLALAKSDNTLVLLPLILNNLLLQGCDWLKDYFVSHPQELNDLPVCQK